MSKVVQMRLFVQVRNAKRRSRIMAALSELPNRIEAPDCVEEIQFSVAYLASKRDLISKRTECQDQPLIFLSDEFLEVGTLGFVKATTLVRQLRESAGADARIGLVAIAPASVARIPDVDQTVSIGFDKSTLQSAILTAAAGVLLKVPARTKRSLGSDQAITVNAVRSRAELEECLKLRYRVYHAMSYLEDEVSRCPAKIELDYFDQLSIHLIARTSDGHVVGTARLIAPSISPFEKGDMVEEPLDLQRRCRQWCHSTAQSVSEPVFRNKLQEAYAVSLPIFQSTDFKDRWGEILQPTGTYAEISRVIVAPEFRGLGISTLLMRTAIAVAYDIGKTRLLLECIPAHTRMYEKFGFRELGGYHSRVQELDQVAAGMQLEISDDLDNFAVQMAKRNLDVIAGSDDPHLNDTKRCLCLCNNTACWKNGSYGFSKAVSCPLTHAPSPVRAA